MTVFKHGRTFRCDFWWHRPRFKAATRNGFASRTPKTSNGRSASTWPAKMASCLSSGTFHRHFRCGRKCNSSTSLGESNDRTTDARTSPLWRRPAICPYRSAGGRVVLAVPRRARLVWTTNCDEIDRATCATRPPNTKEASPQPARKGLRLIVFRKRVPRMPPSRLYLGGRGRKARLLRLTCEGIR
jgi:hypothetical protein